MYVLHHYSAFTMTFVIVGILSSIRLYSFVTNVPVLYDHRLLSDLGQTWRISWKGSVKHRTALSLSDIIENIPSSSS